MASTSSHPPAKTLIDHTIAARFFLQETVGKRDSSHGVAHMFQVANVAMSLCNTVFLTQMDFLGHVFLTGIIHDVRDHKYISDDAAMEALTQQVREFLLGQLAENPKVPSSQESQQVEMILLVADCISFSKEKKAREKGQNRYFEAVFREKLAGYGHVEKALTDQTRYWTQVRDLVSDADKLEAIGKIGLDRCLQFTLERKHSTTVNLEVLEHVEAHAEEKLLRLIEDCYITTPGGVAQGRMQEDIFRAELAKLKDRVTKEGSYELVM